jgi:outer membrane protein assembly factor BamB
MKSRFGAVMAATVSLLMAAAAGAQNWPQFRGPGAAGIAEGKPLPVTWNVEKNENVLWQTEIPGLGHSSPVVWGDRVFLTTAISSDPKAGLRHGLYGDVEPSNDLSPHTWKVYALDRRTGKIIWEQVAHQGAPRTKRHPKSSQATPTPATDGKHVAVSFGSEGLYVYHWNGKLAWKKDLGALNAGWFFDPDYEWGFGSSPIIYKNMVILQCDIQKDSFIAAWDLKTGKEVWRTMRDEIPSWGTPTVVEAGGRAELVANASKFIRGYDALSGKELWRLGPNSEITTPTPFAWQSLIFVTNGYAPIQPIYAVRAGASGDISLKGDATSSDSIAWSVKRGGPYTPTPIVYDGVLYVVSNQGILTAYDAKSGQRIFQERLGKAGVPVSSSSVAGDGKIYFSGEDGEVFVVKAGRQFELLAKNPVGGVMLATPAISDGVIFLRTTQRVIAVGAPAPSRAAAGGRSK